VGDTYADTGVHADTCTHARARTHTHTHTHTELKSFFSSNNGN